MMLVVAFAYGSACIIFWFPNCVDHLLHPEHAPKLKAGQHCWDASFFSGEAAYAEALCARADQLGDPEEAPESCMSIQATDVARNFAEAHQCSEFCRERLGPGLAAPLPALCLGTYPFPCFLVGNSSQVLDFNKTGWEQLQMKLLNTCFKSRVGEVTRGIMDSWWCPWALAAFYRTLGFFWAFYRLRHSPPTPQLADHQAPDPQFCKPDGPFPDGYLGLPFCCSCCYVTSDQQGARCKLWMAFFSILTEPFFDVVSMVALYLC